MRAILYRQYGGYDKLEMAELPVPEPGEGEVLVQMKTASFNALDQAVREGRLAESMHKPLPIIPGSSGVGVVSKSSLKPMPVGTRVAVFGGGRGVTQDGTWREYLTAPAASLTPLAEGLSDAMANAWVASGGYLTALLALSAMARFTQGQTVLAPGISGGLGMETVQIAQVLGASLAISTATTSAKAERARLAGYSHVVDLSKEGLRDGVKRLTRGAGVNVVVDGVGGPLLGQMLGCLADGGTLISVGHAGGSEASLNLSELIGRGIIIRGFTYRHFRPEVVQAAGRDIYDFLVTRRINPVVGKTFPFEQAAEALRCLAEEPPFGRVLLTF